MSGKTAGTRQKGKPVPTPRRGEGQVARTTSLPALDGWVLPQLDYPTFRLALVAKVMDRLTIRRLSEAGGISYSEWRVLSRLMTLKEGATVRQIADLAWVDRAEVSRAVAALEKQGLISRRANSRDLRTPILTLTETGRRKYESLIAVRGAFHEGLMADLSQPERAKLDKLLGKIMHRLLDSLEDEKAL